MAPFGQCALGGPVVRCSFDDGHNWPFYYLYDRPYFGETVWQFFLGNPLSAATVDERDTEREVQGLPSLAGSLPPIAHAATLLPAAQPRVHAQGETIDPRMLGHWVDDYGNPHNITEHVWSQGHDNNYNIKQVDCNRSFFVAQNDATNIWDRLKWSRYDWVFSESIPAPYMFGFCMAAWNATTQEEAETANGVDYNDLYKGCFGWPFTILKRVPRTGAS